MTLIALDLGEKRVGVAISRSGIIAEPLLVLSFGDKFLEELRNICEKEKVKKIIVGLPRSLSGKKNRQEEKIRSIAQEIEKEMKIKIELIDESFTSKIAQSRFKGKDVDQEAACLILESYLAKSRKYK